MNRTDKLLPVTLIMTCFIIGCAQEQQFQPVKQICISQTTKTQLVNTAENVLRQMHFVIDKADTSQGYIRTKPLSGAQFFEFWRSDNVGGLSGSEANLHSIRRIAELEINQQGGQLCISCDTKVQRLSLPEQGFNSSTRVYRMFSQSSSSMQRLVLSPMQKKMMAWVDLGEDARLSTRILKRIEEQNANKIKENTQ